MEKKVKGSWLIHHTSKLQAVTSQAGFENVFLAGKAGVLLSAISANNQTRIDTTRLEALATAANISAPFELPRLIDVLKNRGLIDVSEKGVSVLGLTTSMTLQHTSDLFDSLDPKEKELGALELAEIASMAPVSIQEASEKLCDLLPIKESDVVQLLTDSEDIGFVDTESVHGSEKILFNGNLFRRENTEKIRRVLSSLSNSEQAALIEATELIRTKACVSTDRVTQILGEQLFEKISAVGVFDISFVSNSKEEAGFVTLPSAFSKYSASLVDDAFDLAKALVSSITYGMTKSTHSRGQITMVIALLEALIRGDAIGPVAAIAQDYKILEMKGVVKVGQGTKNGRSGPMMRLLKREVGELALQVIAKGDVSEQSLDMLPTAAVTRFRGPEANRVRIRRKQVQTNPKATADILSVLRTGGF